MTNQRLIAATENYQAKKQHSMTLNRASKVPTLTNHNSDRLMAIASQQQEQRHSENLILLQTESKKISSQERQIAANSLHTLKHRQASVMVRSPQLD